MPFPTSPANGAIYTTTNGTTYVYESAIQAWTVSLSATPVIAQATEAAAGIAQIITQGELNSATALAGNDTDIVTARKLLNMSDPFKAALRAALGVGTTFTAGQFGVGSNVLAQTSSTVAHALTTGGVYNPTPGILTDLVVWNIGPGFAPNHIHRIEYGTWMLVGASVDASFALWCRVA